MISHAKRTLFMLGGLTAVGLGFLGVFLPLLPTTPFLLVAAFCFSKSSERMHSWLMNHKLFGPIIIDWESHGVIRTKVKWISTISMLVMVSYPIVFMIKILWLKALVVMCIACVMCFIWTRPSNPEVIKEPVSG